MIHPIPTLDHVVINVRDRIDEGAATYRRLGFTLTERGYHTLGSMNHLAMFGTDYLELIAAPDPSDLGALFGRMFGTDAVRPVSGGVALTVGVSRFDVVTPEALRADFGDAAPDGGGRDSYMAALAFRTRSVDAAWQVLRD